jgi:asparagine synthase (glutamine-hydrolysing)
MGLFRQYVLPVYQAGDLVAVSEKVAALCQGRVIQRSELRVTPLATLLARCVHQTEAGPGMGIPEKMQFALDLCGTGQVLRAAIRAAWDKLRGVHGTFYRLLGPEIRGLDGFYGADNPAYADLGIRIPEEPDRLCDQVYAATGVRSYLVDANGLGVELLGKAAVITEPEELLLALVRDNPAGQGRQQTPFVLLRRIESEKSEKF